MADPIRNQIMDAIVSALSTISGVNLVSEKVHHWEDLDHKDFPALFPLDQDERKEPLVVFGSAVNNMKGILTVVVTGMLYSADDTTRADRCSLIMAVEKRLCYEASALLALVHSITPTRVVTDKGVVENFSIFDIEFEAEYHYSMESGG